MCGILASEIQCPEVLVAVAVVQVMSGTNTGMGKVRAHEQGAMPRAVHPKLEHLWRGCN